MPGKAKKKSKDEYDDFKKEKSNKQQTKVSLNLSPVQESTSDNQSSSNPSTPPPDQNEGDLAFRNAKPSRVSRIMKIIIFFIII